METIGPVVLPGAAGVHELELAGGRIVGVRAGGAGEPRLALPAFADLHLHADRAYARGGRPPTSLADAVELVSAVKRASTEEHVHERALRLLLRALGHGSVRVRTHVDVDHLVEERALHGVLAARAELDGRLDVEIVAFGTAYTDPAAPEGERRLRRAVEAGANLLGAVPAFHSRPARSLRRLLDLARDLGVDVDVHLDESSDPGQFLLELLADEVVAGGLEGRVTASHCCSLAAVPADVARRTIAKVAAAGVTVVSLPATNLYLQGRGGGTPRARGLTLVNELAQAGCAVRFGSDNVCDIFFPYGDADPLEAAFLAAIGAHVDDPDVLLTGICGGRSRIEAGDPADFVLLDAGSLDEAIARRPVGRTVVWQGRIVADAG